MMKLVTMMKTSAAAAAMVVAVGSTAHADVWDDGGADSEFSTALNWDTDNVPGLLPGTGTDPVTNPAQYNSFNTIDGAFTVERSVDSFLQRTFLQGGATLNVTGGDHSDFVSGANRWNFVGSNSGGVGSSATVNQSGGSWNIGHGFRIGGEATDNNSVYNLSGGSLIVSRGANSAVDPANTGGRPSIEIGGNTIGSGLLEITGGELTTRGPLHLGGTGTFTVAGSAATTIGIGSNGSLDGLWLQKAGGILRAGVDAGGVTPILIDLTTGTGGGFGDAIFESGAILDPYEIGTARGGWNTVMTWEGGLFDSGLTLSSDAVTAGYEMRVDGSNLQVKLNDNAVAVLGDFNGDEVVNLADLDQYIGNIGVLASTPALMALDLDGNGTVGANDFAQHYTDLVATSNGQTGTFAGDANLDGIVDVLGDAAILINNLNTATTSWSQGDFNGDGTVDVLTDAAALINNLGNSNVPAAGPATSAVPEPGSLSLLALAGVVATIRRRR